MEKALIFTHQHMNSRNRASRKLALSSCAQKRSQDWRWKRSFLKKIVSNEVKPEKRTIKNFFRSVEFQEAKSEKEWSKHTLFEVNLASCFTPARPSTPSGPHNPKSRHQINYNGSSYRTSSWTSSKSSLVINSSIVGGDALLGTFQSSPSASWQRRWFTLPFVLLSWAGDT